jgi:hypothetical protein
MIENLITGFILGWVLRPIGELIVKILFNAYKSYQHDRESF